MNNNKMRHEKSRAFAWLSLSEKARDYVRASPQTLLRAVTALRTHFANALGWGICRVRDSQGAFRRKAGSVPVGQKPIQRIGFRTIRKKFIDSLSGAFARPLGCPVRVV